MLPDESANQRQPGGGGAGAGNGQPGGNTNGGGSALQGGVGFVPEGIRKVTYDPTTNSLIVEGDDDAIKQLRNLVNLFDQVPKQVIVKVEFITTSQSVTKALGMDWLGCLGWWAAAWLATSGMGYILRWLLRDARWLGWTGIFGPQHVTPQELMARLPGIRMGRRV